MVVYLCLYRVECRKKQNSDSFSLNLCQIYYIFRGNCYIIATTLWNDVFIGASYFWTPSVH